MWVLVGICVLVLSLWYLFRGGHRRRGEESISGDALQEPANQQGKEDHSQLGAGRACAISAVSLSIQKNVGINDVNRPIIIALPKNLVGHMESTCFRTTLLELVQLLTQVSSVFLLCEATCDEGEARMRQVLSQALPTLPQHRLLFHGSEIGKVAIVRQVSPALLIDCDYAFCEKLKPHLKRILHYKQDSERQDHEHQLWPPAAAARAGGSGTETVPPSSSCIQTFPNLLSILDLCAS